MFWTHFEGFLVASEVTTASKRPWRSDLTSDLKSVTSITYVPITLSGLQQPPSTNFCMNANDPPTLRLILSSIDFAAAIAPLVTTIAHSQSGAMN